ncbi:ABC transporter substrate-binding protein [Rhodospirillaceae bacterium KN72]|uniref:ABC transporter substrate-binding protein n=1 Tax=Pacificispira spongiicola TaxID=2729598 RepID=A0A7Y0HF72_9PROT|nr:ABC transporter substrate-binding protein [Pacificispira spongiicola]NMM43657.1 ABC transporter substrate-binding protein [Pacificispira spongiicola]
MNRRTLLQGAAALGLLPVLPTAAKATPNAGGHVRVAMGHGGTSDSYDPATYANNYIQAQTYGRNNMLTEIAPDGSLRGELAENYEASEDAKTWRFRLRKGVTFHNGKSLSVDDVIASINYHRGEDSKSAVKSLVAPVVDLRADGDWVVFELESGNADFPYLFADYHFSVFPAEDGKIDFSQGVGTGGYKIKAFEPGVRTELVRNPDYWKSDAAFFDEIELLTVLDATARVTALTTGEVDIADKIDPKTGGLVARSPGVTLMETAGTQHFTFAMDTRQAPFNDVNVRQALKYGINRQELVDKILSGYGTVGNDHPISRSNVFFNHDLEQREYDPDRAKYHLQQAGLDSVSVELHAADAAFTGAVDAATLYRESAAACGIDIGVVREPNDGYWKNVWMQKPWTAVYWSGRPTADWMFTTAYAADAKFNDSFWGNERFNQLLSAARAELDQTKRTEMYHEMQAIVRDDGGVVIPMFANYISARRDTVGAPETVGSNFDLDGLRFVERWWKT